MKKLLTLCAAVLISFSLWATDVVPSFVESNTANQAYVTNVSGVGNLYFASRTTTTKNNVTDHVNYRTPKGCFVFELTAATKIDISFYSTSAGRSVKVGLYTVDATTFSVWQGAAGQSSTMDVWLADHKTDLAADGETTLDAYYAAKGFKLSSGSLTSGSDNQKALMPEATYNADGLTNAGKNIYTEYYYPTDASSLTRYESTIVHVNNGNSIPAGKYIMTIGDSGSNIGIEKISFTPTVTTYTVTYDGNGNTSGDAPTDSNSPYNENATVTVLGNTGSLAKTGYSFADWNNKADGTGADFAAAGTFSITKDTTLYAKWTANTYNITLSAGTGATAAGAATVDYDATSLTITEATTGTGALKGFYTTSNGDVKVAEANGVLVEATVEGYVTSGKWSRAADTELFAQYSTAYNVRFFPGFGENAQIGATQSIASGNSAVAPDDPTRSGYEFLGWSISTSADDIKTVASYAITATTDFTAIWDLKYSVTYSLNGASGDAPTQEAVTAGTAITLAAEPERDGYRFDGWLCNIDSDVREAGASYTMTAAATTFTAQWTAIYSVTYALNGGSGDAPTQAAVPATTKITLAAAPSRTHYTFDGWKCNIDEATYAAGAQYTMTAAPTTFTAQWTEDANATVSFQVDGAAYSSQKVYVGEKVAAVDAPTKAGYVFAGWYNGESKFDFTANVASTDAITLDASWEAADANHYSYAYNDDFHYDGQSYHTPEGKVAASGDNKALTTPYTLFSGASGITSVIATSAQYDGKGTHMNSYLKIATGGTAKIEFTIATGYTAVLKLKMGGYSANPTVTIKDAEDKTVSASGSIGGVATTANNYNEITYNLTAGTSTLTVATKNLYISHIDLQTTVIPTALDNTADEAKAVKFIENGMLIIEKNGVRYNAQGQVLR